MWFQNLFRIFKITFWNLCVWLCVSATVITWKRSAIYKANETINTGYFQCLMGPLEVNMLKLTALLIHRSPFKPGQLVKIIFNQWDGHMHISPLNAYTDALQSNIFQRSVHSQLKPSEKWNRLSNAIPNIPVWCGSMKLHRSVYWRILAFKVHVFHVQRCLANSLVRTKPESPLEALAWDLFFLNSSGISGRHAGVSHWQRIKSRVIWSSTLRWC